jgi:hypothetical protein
MRKMLQLIISNFKKNTPRTGVYMTVTSGQVIIAHTDGKFGITPELARRLAAELPALATIAERLEAAP